MLAARSTACRVLVEKSVAARMGCNFIITVISCGRTERPPVFFAESLEQGPLGALQIAGRAEQHKDITRLQSGLTRWLEPPFPPPY